MINQWISRVTPFKNMESMLEGHGLIFRHVDVGQLTIVEALSVLLSTG